jgi:hypothetical protein
MHRAISPHDIAARIRGLIGDDPTAINSAALRLGVSDVALHISVDRDDPHPAIEVLDAIVWKFGVDPTWLLTGDYDFAAHQRAIEGIGEFAGATLAPLLGEDVSPPTKVNQPGEPTNVAAAAPIQRQATTSNEAPVRAPSPEHSPILNAAAAGIPTFPNADYQRANDASQENATAPADTSGVQISGSADESFGLSDHEL